MLHVARLLGIGRFCRGPPALLRASFRRVQSPFLFEFDSEGFALIGQLPRERGDFSRHVNHGFHHAATDSRNMAMSITYSLTGTAPCGPSQVTRTRSANDPDFFTRSAEGPSVCSAGCVPVRATTCLLEDVGASRRRRRPRGLCSEGSIATCHLHHRPRLPITNPTSSRSWIAVGRRPNRMRRRTSPLRSPAEGPSDASYSSDLLPDEPTDTAVVTCGHCRHSRDHCNPSSHGAHATQARRQ